jgi:hypothetical protein
MKHLLVILFAAALYTSIFAQGLSQADLERSRIEQAFRDGNFTMVEDMLPRAMTIRLEDSLYTNVSCITALNLINSFLSNKDNIKFRMSSNDNGEMSYVQNGSLKKINVDLFFGIEDNNIVIRSMNISNYPIPTMFFKNRKS